MTENLTTALVILAIGMGVVFASIILLWGVMAALVRLTADRAPVTPPAEPGDSTTAALAELHRQAAVAAVAVARQHATNIIGAKANPPTASVSPWQAVMRGRQFRQRGPVR